MKPLKIGCFQGQTVNWPEGINYKFQLLKETILQDQELVEDVATSSVKKEGDGTWNAVDVFKQTNNSDLRWQSNFFFPTQPHLITKGHNNFHDEDA